jgi:ribosome-binding protein aMBF1 (putative translation factor)
MKTVNTAGVKLEDIKEKLMQDTDFRAEYDRLLPRYEAISQIINERGRQKISQQELAKRIGTQKSNISRFESGDYNPSLDFLSKLAHGLGKEIHVVLK